MVRKLWIVLNIRKEIITFRSSVRERRVWSSIFVETSDLSLTNSEHFFKYCKLKNLSSKYSVYLIMMITEDQSYVAVVDEVCQRMIVRCHAFFHQILIENRSILLSIDR